MQASGIYKMVLKTVFVSSSFPHPVSKFCSSEERALGSIHCLVLLTLSQESRFLIIALSCSPWMNTQLVTLGRQHGLSVAAPPNSTALTPGNPVLPGCGSVGCSFMLGSRAFQLLSICFSTLAMAQAPDFSVSFLLASFPAVWLIP